MPSRAIMRWCLTALLAWSGHALAWDYTPDATPRLISVLGFLTVQSQALDRIIQRFPGRREGLIRARTQFDNTFPQVLVRTRRLIAGIPLSDDECRLLIERALGLHQPSVGVATQTAETVHSLAGRVVARAQGSQDRVTLQTLLAVAYDDRPADELGSRFTQAATLSSWPNARGASLALRLPFSWERVPPTTPRKPDPARVVIGAWTNQDGFGLSRIGLIVRPTGGDPETMPGSHEPHWMRDAVRQAVAAPCRLLSWGMQLFGGRIGVWASYIGESPEPNIPHTPGNTLVGRVFMVPTDDALLMLHIQSLATSLEQASAACLRYEPLWDAVAASFSVSGAKPQHLPERRNALSKRTRNARRANSRQERTDFGPRPSRCRATTSRARP